MLRQLLKIFQFTLIILLISLAACSLPGGNDTNNSGRDDPANQTAAAQTVAAITTSSPGSDTSEPDSPASTPTEVLNDDATFIGDITIPDKLAVEVGGTFTKTWRVQNSGDSTWTTEYQLVFESGDQMGSPSSVPIPFEVAPGGTIDVSVDFTVPDTPGGYKSVWIFQNAAGDKFGVGRDGDLPIWMEINAVAPGQGSNTGGIAGGANITNVTISVDQAVYSGSCPVNLFFSGNITTSDSGTVLYSIDFGTSTSGFTFDPSGTFTRNFSAAGALGWQYTLILTSSVVGTARVNATGSNTFNSGILGFSVSCD